MGDGDVLGELAANLDPPMAVVTTALRGERAGCLIGFHAQCSIDPPRYVIWLSRANHTYRVGLLAPRFALHFLSQGEHDLAELFGGASGDHVDKFSRCDWRAGPDDVPLLNRVPNRVVGRRGAVLDEGSDHVCIVLEVDHVDYAAPFQPLRLSMVNDITPGHGADERPVPANERSKS